MQENELAKLVLGHKKCTDNFDNRVESAHCVNSPVLKDLNRKLWSSHYAGPFSDKRSFAAEWNFQSFCVHHLRWLLFLRTRLTRISNDPAIKSIIRSFFGCCLMMCPKSCSIFFHVLALKKTKCIMFASFSSSFENSIENNFFCRSRKRVSISAFCRVRLVPKGKMQTTIIKPIWESKLINKSKHNMAMGDFHWDNFDRRKPLDNFRLHSLWIFMRHGSRMGKWNGLGNHLSCCPRSLWFQHPLINWKCFYNSINWNRRGNSSPPRCVNKR